MEIRAFRGWRYKAGRRADISPFIAPPYDILSGDDKRRLLALSDKNIVAVDMPHVPPNDLGPDEVYRAAAEKLAQWKASGVLVQDEAPAIYAYRQDFHWAGKSYTRRALICGVRATELGRDVIPHEHTFAGPKADRLALTQYTRMQLSPIFGFYRDKGNRVTDILADVTTAPPNVFGKCGQVEEKLWVIHDSATILAIASALKAEPVFIADGHHRYTTALNYRDSLAGGGKLSPDHEANFVMFALVARNDPGLLILPTHRIIRNLSSDFSLDKLRAAASEFAWTRCALPAELADADTFLRLFGSGAMAIIPAGEAQTWIARLKQPEQSDAWRKLDVSILHKLIIDKALSPWKTDRTAIDYTPDAKAVMEVCRSGAAQLGICLQGTSLESVESIARSGDSMPHKSTYFYPKLSTGLVLKPLE